MLKIQLIRSDKSFVMVHLCANISVKFRGETVRCCCTQDKVCFQVLWTSVRAVFFAASFVDQDDSDKESRV